MAEKVVIGAGAATKPPVPAGKLRKPDSVAAQPARVAKNTASKARMSFMALVMAPSLLFGAYNIFATDRFAATANFVVRSQTSGQGGSEFMDTLTGSVSSGSTKSDSYIVRRFIDSADLMRLVDEEFDLDRIYGAASADPLQRLRHGSTFEQKLAYWNRRAFSTYDHTTGILTLEVQAFDPQTAERIANRVVEHVRALVDGLSAEARDASYDFARSELKTAEDVLRTAQAALMDFRSRNGITDANASAIRDDALIRELDTKIIETRTSLSVLQNSVSNEGANARQLSDRLLALETQRANLISTIGEGANRPGVVTAELMNANEMLLFDLEIARKRYMVLLESMESARRDAEKGQRYLAVFAHPYAAEEAAYPRRIIEPLICFIALSLFWSIFGFAIQMVRDHRR